MSKLKKTLALLLSFIMIFSMLPVTALAADEFTATIGSATVEAGKTVDVTVNLSNNPGFTSFEFDIKYDTTKLKLTKILSGSVLKDEDGEAIGSLTPNVDGNRVSYANTTLVTSDGSLLKLRFEALSSASGNVEVSLQPNSESPSLNQYGFATKTAVVTKHVPGTITVKADTTDRTVRFMNGDSEVKSETVANGGKLTAIPAAPVAVNGQSFLGWYAVDGTNYVLSNVDDTITGTEASTDTAITADTTYHAIWASNVMIAAGYAAAANGKTTMSAISAPAKLQTLITDCNNGKVKLLSDVDLGSNHIEIAQGKAISLDLNGKTLSSTDSNIPFWGSTTPCGTVYVEQGTLTLYSSAAEKGTVHYTFTGTGNWKSFGWGAVENFGGTIPVIKNVTVKTTTVGKGATNPPSALFGRAYADATTDNPAFESVSDCAFICDNGAAFTCVGDSSGEMKTASFKNCTFSGTSIGKSNGVIGLVYTRIGEFTDCEIQANANSATDGTALSLSDNAKIISVTGGTMTAPNGIYTTSYYGDDLTAIEKFNPNSVTVTAEDGFLMNITSGGFGKAVNVNLNGGKYNTNKIVLEKGTTITYPAGQKLVAGEDGWYTLQNAYTVKFMNGDTVLQESDCLANSSVKYNGTEPTKPAEGGKEYVFTGWNTASDGTGTKYSSDASIPVTGDLTLYAQFRVATAYTWVLTPDKTDYNAGETVTVTVSAYGAAESQISSFGFNTTFNADQLTVPSVKAAFTGGLVESKGGKLGYVISGKAPITISGDKNSPTKLATITFKVNDGKNGTANIKLNDFEMAMPGTTKGETVSVEPITVNLHDIQITLNAGNSTITGGATTYYAKVNEAGLYTDAGRQTKASAPTVAAADGYRLADESKGEKLWQSGETGYTTEELLGTLKFTESKTFTVNTVKQWTVTFAPGEHGTFAAGTGTPLTLDEGTDLSTITMPTVQPSAGYVFDTWTKAPAMDTLTGDVTYTATYKAGTYEISFPTIEKVTFTPGEGITNGKVTYGTDAKFKMTVADGLKVKKVSYKIGETTTGLKENEGTYTIPGTALTGNVTIVVDSVATYTVEFKAGENGAVAKTLTVDAGYALKDSDIPKPTPNAGYRFVEWRLDGSKATLVGMKVNENLVFTAIFDDASYTISADGMGGVPATATHGTEFTFTPVVNGKIVTGITVKNGETVVPATKNADGSYTIAGNDITGNLTITATTVDGTWEFISQEKYAALSADTQIAKLKTAKLAGDTYQLSSDKMFWSEKYGAYVAIVSTAETAGTLTAKLTTVSGAAEEISYNGDINGSGSVTPVDGTMINDELQKAERVYPLSDKQRFEMDVNCDGQVTTSDIVLILQRYVGNTTF